MEEKTQDKSRKKIFQGRVVSNKMDKTIVVEVARRKLQPLYKKYVKVTKKIKAHDENNECNFDDIVKVIEHRPYSKEKCWKLLEIVERAK
ncbi:MAG: 30S ribosomal protein S17 [Spirochaetales bacterium]|nr:30S ribosomal protein S17 [Spirochaetales bacterium]